MINKLLFFMFFLIFLLYFNFIEIFYKDNLYIYKIYKKENISYQYNYIWFFLNENPIPIFIVENNDFKSSKNHEIARCIKNKKSYIIKYLINLSNTHCVAIVLNKVNWQSLNDLEKKYVIMHETGHALLGFNDNNYLENHQKHKIPKNYMYFNLKEFPKTVNYFNFYLNQLKQDVNRNKFNIK